MLISSILERLVDVDLSSLFSAVCYYARGRYSAYNVVLVFGFVNEIISVTMLNK